MQYFPTFEGFFPLFHCSEKVAIFVRMMIGNLDLRADSNFDSIIALRHPSRQVFLVSGFAGSLFTDPSLSSLHNFLLQVSVDLSRAIIPLCNLI